jgi:hypothetical protein
MAVKMSMCEAGHRNQKVVKPGGLDWRFTDKQYTAWGGLRVLEEMLRRVRFSDALRQSQLPQPGSNRGFDPIDVMQSFLVSVWVGGTRFAHTALLRFDQALRQIFGLSQVPSTSTFTRFFRRFRRRQVDQVFGYLAGWFWKQLQPMTLTLDLDSTVLTRYAGSRKAVCGAITRFGAASLVSTLCWLLPRKCEWWCMRGCEPATRPQAATRKDSLEKC